MATRWGREVDDAIREAAAGGLRFSVAFRKLKAGTLDGIGPVAMPERTFAYKWRTANREQEGAARADNQRPWPNYLNLIRMGMLLEEGGFEDFEGLSAEEIAEAIGWPVRYVRGLLARREAFSAGSRPPIGPPRDETEAERELEEIAAAATGPII